MIPRKEQNPKGLHMRYQVRKIVGTIAKRDFFENLYYEPELKNVDEGSEYFVMRLDDGGSDPIHIKACRNAVLHYANEIKDHLPKLSQDLIKRYSQSKI